MTTNTTNKYLPYILKKKPQKLYRFVLNNPNYNIDALQRHLLARGYTSSNPLTIDYGIARSDDAPITAIYATQTRLYSVTDTGLHYFTPGISTLASIAKVLSFLIPDDLVYALSYNYPENVIEEEL